MSTTLMTMQKPKQQTYNEGKDITGAVVVEWNWEKYPGYCRNLTDIGIAGGRYFLFFEKRKRPYYGK